MFMAFSKALKKATELAKSNFTNMAQFENLGELVKIPIFVG